jgi:hypothetical protein
MVSLVSNAEEPLDIPPNTWSFLLYTTPAAWIAYLFSFIVANPLHTPLVNL